MDRSMTGYQIRQRFSLSFSFFSGISFGSIYPALKALEQNELIRTRLEIQDGAPNRKICTITEKGRLEFLKSLRAPLAVERYKNAFIARMFFFVHLAPEERLKFAHQYLDVLDETQKKLMDIQPQMKNHADPFEYICFKSGQRIIRDLIETIQEAVESLKALEKEK